MNQFIGSQNREGIWLAESINNALLLLDVFDYKAKDALPHLKQIIMEMEADGLEKRDAGRWNVIKHVIRWLEDHHGLAISEGATDANQS